MCSSSRMLIITVISVHDLKRESGENMSWKRGDGGGEQDL